MPIVTVRNRTGSSLSVGTLGVLRPNAAKNSNVALADLEVLSPVLQALSTAGSIQYTIQSSDDASDTWVTQPNRTEVSFSFPLSAGLSAVMYRLGNTNANRSWIAPRLYQLTSIRATLSEGIASSGDSISLDLILVVSTLSDDLISSTVIASGYATSDDANEYYWNTPGADERVSIPANARIELQTTLSLELDNTPELLVDLELTEVV